MHSLTFLDFTERQGRCKVAEWLQKIRAAVVQVCGCHFISRSSKSLLLPPYRWSSNGNYGAGLGVRLLSSQFLLQPVIAQAADPVSSKLCGAISVLCFWRGDEEGWGLCGRADRALWTLKQPERYRALTNAQGKIWGSVCPGWECMLKLL